MATNRRDTLLVLLATTTILIGVPTAHGFQEGWESAPIGTYVPTRGDSLPRLIPGDAGDWVMGDTVATVFPDCGDTPHQAEVIDRNGSHVFRLTSEDSNTGCADNVWAALEEVPVLDLNPGFSVPLSSDTIISFTATSALVNPQADAPDCSLGPPCGDTVALFVQDNRGNVLAYILQRAPGAVPNPLYVFYREIFLDPGGGTFSRNLFDDFSTIPAFDPVGVSIELIDLNVDEHGWVEIDNLCIATSGCATAPVMQAGDVLIDFGGIGLWARMNDASWLKLNNGSPDQMVAGDMDGNGEDDMIAVFSSGIFVKRNLGAWAQLHNLIPEQMAVGDLDNSGRDDVVIDFGGIGLWARMNDTSWLKLNNSSPDQLAVGDMDGNGQDDVIADFGSTLGGLFVKRNLGSWSQLHNSSPEALAVGDLDNSGRDDVLVDFGGIGLWARMNDASWLKLHNSSPQVVATGDLDGNGGEDVLATFSGLGLWQKLNLGGWSKLNNNAPDQVVTTDVTANGQDDIVADFGSSMGGIFVKRDQGAWVKLHNSSPDSMATGNLDGQ